MALPERLNCPYYYQPHPLCILAAEEVKAQIASMDEWAAEVGKGKMFGVLVVKDKEGRVGYLKAFSGQICSKADWDGWVPAVFDYLQPDGYFCTKEATISYINNNVRARECSSKYAQAKAEMLMAEKESQERIDAYRRMMAESKARREILRNNGEGDETEMIRESQYQKAELKRLKAREKVWIEEQRSVVQRLDKEIAGMKQERKRRSDALQHWLFSQFVMVNGHGERKNLIDIFRDYGGIIPPSGSGECCAPKLLQYALLHGYTPVAMAEFWWGESPKMEIRQHGNYYPACQGKCRPILDFMLQGLDVEENPLEMQEQKTDLKIIYEDEWMMAIDKPAGMLSVSGKGDRLSAQELLARDLPEGDNVRLPVHRLDMQTSGILLFAKSEAVAVMLRSMFESRQIHKEYIAVVSGVMPMDGTGRIELPLSADYVNRPRQRVDRQNGKAAITDYKVLGVENGNTRLLLKPLTGRTHQLRVHCAHHEGLGKSIIGDDLYGFHHDRLMLHAHRLTFVHPITHNPVVIMSECPF